MFCRSTWTEEEDEKLRSLVATYGDKNWPAIVNEMGGRTEAQCTHRWIKTLDPSIHSGRWELEEDRVRPRFNAFSVRLCAGSLEFVL